MKGAKRFYKEAMMNYRSNPAVRDQFPIIVTGRRFPVYEYLPLQVIDDEGNTQTLMEVYRPDLVYRKHWICPHCGSNERAIIEIQLWDEYDDAGKCVGGGFDSILVCACGQVRTVPGFMLIYDLEWYKSRELLFPKEA